MLKAASTLYGVLMMKRLLYLPYSNKRLKLGIGQISSQQYGM
jgi:hypothetical protein